MARFYEAASNFYPVRMTAVKYFYLYGRWPVPILKMRGRKDIRKNGSRKHPSTSLIPSFGRRSQGNFRPRIYFSIHFLWESREREEERKREKGQKYFRDAPLSRRLFRGLRR